MLRRLLCVLTACLASVVCFALPASADAPQVMESAHFEGLAPVISAACGFKVTRVLDRYLVSYSDKHFMLITLAAFSGPTGRSFSATTKENVIVRTLPDGTSCTPSSGRISLLHFGHELQSSPDETEHCRSVVKYH